MSTKSNETFCILHIPSSLLLVSIGKSDFFCERFISSIYPKITQNNNHQCADLSTKQSKDPRTTCKSNHTCKHPGSHTLTKLDINFARLYFDALANSCLDQTKVPRAWMALCETCDNPNIERVQFALAGKNAHINHDLPLALVQTCKDMHTSPQRDTREYSDFENVNSLLSGVMPTTLNVLATGILGEITQDTGTIGRFKASTQRAYSFSTENSCPEREDTL